IEAAGSRINRHLSDLPIRPQHTAIYPVSVECAIVMPKSFGGSLMESRLEFVGFLTLVACSSLSAQVYRGTFTDNQTPNVHSSLVVNLQISAGRITGGAGVGQPGQNPAPSMALTGTFSGGTCTVTVE